MHLGQTHQQNGAQIEKHQIYRLTIQSSHPQKVQVFTSQLDGLSSHGLLQVSNEAILWNV
jgi:hypothetical protein